jgi:hypothetical protein
MLAAAGFPEPDPMRLRRQKIETLGEQGRPFLVHLAEAGLPIVWPSTTLHSDVPAVHYGGPALRPRPDQIP